MACNEDIIPRCGEPEPLLDEEYRFDSGKELISTIATILIITGIIFGTLIALQLLIKGAIMTNGVMTGVVAAGVSAVVILIIVAHKFNDVCGTPKGGTEECIAGVVISVRNSFEKISDNVFPYTNSHPYMQVLVKSIYWPLLERNRAYVFCTEEDIPRKSEVIKCYFKDDSVCKSMTGALIGTMTGVVAGMVAAGFTAAAIGCLTFWFCLIGIIVGLVLGALAAILGAFVGSEVGKANKSDVSAESSESIEIGNLISIRGNLIKREEDNNSNTIRYISWIGNSGRAPISIPDNPYSYCEIDEVFEIDSCII